MNIAADEKLDLTTVTKRDEGISTFSDQDQKIFQVLHDVVQPGQAIMPDAAAEHINQHLHNLPGRSGDKQKDTEVVEDFVDSVWSLLTSIAENTPYNHPAQDRLIDFMQALVQKLDGNYSFWGVSLKKMNDFRRGYLETN